MTSPSIKSRLATRIESALSGGLLPLARALSGAPTTPAKDEESAFEPLLRDVLREKANFTFNYQPVVDIRRGVVVGYEGLVRFGGGLQWSPDRWFAGAERYGLRLDLEALVTRKLLETRGHLPRNCFMSVNASPSFVLSPAFDRMLLEGGYFGGLVFEITENEAVADYKPLCEIVSRIRQAGGCVAVDDAGSGYASLQHIMLLKPDFVKLDRVFVKDCDTDRAKSALMEMVGKAAGRLDAWVIAEGVETAGELDELIRLEVPMAQGYFLSRPAPEMRHLREEESRALMARVKLNSTHDIAANAAEATVVCTNEEAATRFLSTETQAQTAVVTDDFGRPVSLIERHPLMGVRAVSSLMRAQLATPDVQLLERALTRPVESQFDPIVAINEEGELMGVVRVDRLMKQVLTRVPQS